jgi:glycosyltransferase involved in cell wall biosynthesis
LAKTSERRKNRKILILGMSPLPFENDRKVYGTGIRTWQFIEPLIRNGHKICVCNYAIPSAYPQDFKSLYQGKFIVKRSTESSYEFDYNILKKDDFENTGILKEILLKFDPECIVGCSFYPSFIAAKLINSVSSQFKIVPFWADLFGHVMAEAQARAFVDDDDGCLFHYWHSEYNIIATADIFSSVSDRQAYALIGELGAAGRLNKYTSGYNFINTVPCGMPAEKFVHKKSVIRGKNNISDDDFVILWTGGYNTWTDVDTLFEGLILSMEKNPKIKFVSTGGEIPEQDLKTYPRFISMIEKCKFTSNFVMNGWIAGEDVPNYFFEADIGINIDKNIYEVRLGSKSRILDWMRAGLAVLSSNVCELTEIMEREKIGYTFKSGDAKDLSEKIIYLSNHKDEAKKTGIKGKDFGKKQFSFNATTKPLQEWSWSPTFAPDKSKENKILLDKDEAIRNLDRIVAGQSDMIAEKDMRIKELEAIVKKTLVYRFYTYARIAKRKIFK